MVAAAVAVLIGALVAGALGSIAGSQLPCHRAGKPQSILKPITATPRREHEPLRVRSTTTLPKF
jgi:hypothetical protein